MRTNDTHQDFFFFFLYSSPFLGWCGNEKAGEWIKKRERHGVGLFGLYISKSSVNSQAMAFQRVFFRPLP